MRKSWLLCALLGTLAWGQAVPASPPAAQSAPATGNIAKPQTPATQADTAAAVPPDAPVITVNGVCAPQPKTAAAKPAGAKPASVAKTPTADCKTVITKAEFEKLASGISPNVTPQLKRSLAGALPRFIAMSNEAKKRGLDKNPTYDELLKFAKMQILTNELTRKIQEEAANIPQDDIAKYYQQNAESYEEYNLERLFVPRAKQVQPEAKEEEKKDEKLTDEQQKAKQAEEKAKQDESEQAMTQLAESLRARAAAGEDFMKLQKEAFEAGGTKIESPTVSLPKVRRNGLPPAHSTVFDLKPGEVSQVINDAGGHYIYKMTGKEQLGLDQVKDEIHNKLQNDRLREMMDKVNGSFKVDTNEAYFGPGGTGPMPPGPRMPNPRMAPRPMAPETVPQTPPPAQSPTAPQAQPQAPPPPAQPPAAKPN